MNPITQEKAQQQKRSRWRLKPALMLGFGCLTSPCCTPLLLPLGLALIAGTPLALWLSANLGLVYALLTLVSIASFLLGLHWLRRKSSGGQGANTVRVSDITVFTKKIVSPEEAP